MMRILADLDTPVFRIQFGSWFGKVWGSSRDANLAKKPGSGRTDLWRPALCGRCGFCRRRAASPACWQSAGQSWPTSDAERWCSGWCPHLQTNRQQSGLVCVQFFSYLHGSANIILQPVCGSLNPEFFIPISKKNFFFWGRLFRIRFKNCLFSSKANQTVWYGVVDLYLVPGTYLFDMI